MSSARQALTIVGQIAGSFFGPIGSVIGGFIGGEIGGAIDGPPEGPRLDDTSAPAIEFGAKVPRVYGRVWCTLSPRWWSGLRESSAVVGGKGGDSGVEQYSYHADLLGALADGANVLDWTRIRIDGEIVASRLAGASAATLAAAVSTDRWSDVELFPGAAAQVPWSVLEAAEGVGSSNAYRGQCTIGFTNLLMPNGRRPSLIEVEVITQGTQASSGDGLLCHFDTAASDPDFVVSALGPDVELGTGSSLDGSGGEPGFAGNGTGGSGGFLAQGITGTLDQSWRVDMFYTPPSAFGYQILQVASSVTGNQISVASPWPLPDNALVVAYDSDLGTGGAAIGVGAQGPVLGVVNHLAVQYRHDTQRIDFFHNGAYIATIGSGNFFGADTFDVLRAGNGASMEVDEVYFRLGVPAGELYDYGGYAVPAVPWVAFSGVAWTPAPEDLQDVLEAELLRCKPLTAAQIDMSAAAGKEVHGFKAFNSAATDCAVLLNWYFLDMFCDDKIRLCERGGASEQTIAYGYSGAGVDAASEPFAGLERGNDTEVPVRAAVQYTNILADGEGDTRTGLRIAAGSKVQQFAFPIYALPSEAQGRADTITHDARNASHRATIRLGATQAAKVQPASVLTLTDNKGNSYRCRVLRIVWNRGVYECEVVLDDPNILTAVGIAVDTDSQVIDIAAPAEAEFIALDLPKLRTADNDPAYLALVKTSEHAAGARWFDSPDDVTYAAKADFAHDATFGTITALVGGFDRGEQFDEGSTITASLGPDAAPASATRTAILADRQLNAFAAGINGRLVLGQYRTATALGAGVWTFSGLLVGAKGTARHGPNLIAGDRFALLGAPGTALVPRDVTQLGVPMFVKAVAVGRAFDSALGQAFTCAGVNVTPLAPLDLRAARDSGSGDITLSWIPCTRDDTRFGGDLGDAWAHGEAAELYRVRLYTDITGTTLVRDLGSVTSPTATYTAAQRATDGHTLTSPLYVRVTMVSAVVGEGTPLLQAA